MEIVKILNNNAVLANETETDYIIIGGGIGFNQKVGQEIPEEKIERKFIALNETNTNRFAKLLEDIPIEYVELADEIIVYAKSKLKYDFSNSIYVSLTDHLHNLVKIAKEGFSVSNPLSWEIKKFYPLEYEVGLFALDLIKKQFDLEFDESESGNIAMHFINAQLDGTSCDTFEIQEITKKIRDIVALVRMHNQIEIDESSLAFDRFVTHLRFFFKRIHTLKDFEKSNPLLVTVVERYPQAYDTTKLIEEYLKVILNDDEQLYLTLHIEKLIENQ